MCFHYNSLSWSLPTDPETEIQVQVIYLRGAGNVGRNMEQRKREATNKGYIIKPSTTMAPKA